MLPTVVLNVEFYRNELIDCFINSKYDLFGIDFKIPYKIHIVYLYNLITFVNKTLS